MERPDWWSWELALTFHAEVRLEDRGLSEIELRSMLEDATALLPARTKDRWIVRTRHRDRLWIVILEVDRGEQVIHVVTAYPRDMQP